MKVFLIDYAGFKTSRHWKTWLGENHTLVTDMYFNPVYAEWADVIYVEWCETPAIEVSRLKGHYEDVYDHEGVRGERNKQYSGDFDWSGKPIFIRAIDIDVYYGHFRSVQWENITGLIYIAKHIWSLMEKHNFPASLKTYHVPLSIKLDEWTWREHNSEGRDIAWVNHHWSAKGMPIMLQALETLIRKSGDKRWKLHIVENGKSTEWWLFDYLQHIAKEMGIEENIVIYPSVPSVNEFLEDKDYAVSSSHKEAFSLFTAEALAKGIKTLTHNWWGATDIWPKEIVWTTVDEFFLKMCTGVYDSVEFRKIAALHSHDKEIEQLRQVTGL
jgi:glycosyltransferase involved in cell wall biosynthesis